MNNKKIRENAAWHLCSEKPNYVSYLKEISDFEKEEPKYQFTRIPSPDHTPIYRCHGTYKQHQASFVGLGKKQPKQEVSAQLLALLLAQAGDVESNPGPRMSRFETFYREELIVLRQLRQYSLRSKIARLENLRKRKFRYTIAQKIQLRKTSRARKFAFLSNATEQEFKCQMNGLGEELKNIASSIMSPTTIRTAAYAGANFLSPGTGTAAACVVEGNKIIRTMENVTNTVEELSSHIPRSLQRFTNLSDVASVTLNTITQTFERLSQEEGLLAKMEKAITAVTSISSTTLLITILVILISLTWDWKVTMAVIIAVLVMQKWPQSVITKIKDILFGFKFQMNLPENVFSLIGQVIFTLFAFFGVSKIPADKYYDSILRRLDTIPKACVGTGKIWDAAGKTFEAAADEFKIFFLGTKREDLHYESEIAKQIKTWVERVKYYSDAKQYLLIARDAATVKEIEQLFSQMYRWKHTPAIWKSLPQECQRILTSLTPTMQDLFKRSTKSTVHEGGPRRAPLGVFISGDSGCGKSEMLMPLAYALLNNRGLEESADNFKQEIYVRNYETEYWDAYVGQKIVVFDDAFQMKDTAGNPSPEFMESIRLLNTAPAHIHCADTVDKGRFFSSEICIYTTNLSRNFRSFINSVNCPEAAIRRLNVNAYRVRPRKEYATRVVVGTANQNVNPHHVSATPVDRLSVRKVKKCPQCKVLRQKDPSVFFCPHSQVFERYDIFTDEVLEQDLSYSDVLRQLYEYDIELCRSEARKLESYEALIKNPRMYDNEVFDPNFQCQMSVETEMFEESQEHFSHGALDMRVPTDVVALHELMLFLNVLTANGIIDQDRREVEIAQHPQLWATWQRRIHCGLRNSDTVSNEPVDLVSCMQQAGIQYNTEQKAFEFRTGLRQNIRFAIASFEKWCHKLTLQVTNFWKKAGFEDIINLMLVGLTMLSLAGMAYFAFSTCKCEATKMQEQNWERVYTSENRYDPAFTNTRPGFTVEANEVPVKTVEEWMKLYDQEPNALQTDRNSFLTKISHFVSKQHELNAILRELHTETRYDLPKTKPAFKTETYETPKATTPRFKTETCVPIPKPRHSLEQLETRYDPTPRTQPRFKTETKVERATSFQSEMYADKACQAIEQSIINKSLYAIHSDQTVYGNVIFIRGTTFLMNAHYLEYFRTKPREMKLYLSSLQGRLVEMTVGTVLDSAIRLKKQDEDVDAVIVPLDGRISRVSPHPDILRLFVKNDDLGSLLGRYNVQLPSYVRSTVKHFYVTARSLCDFQFKDMQEMLTGENFRLKIARAWTYFGSTDAGDCGAPLIINHDHATRKIAGIHMGSRNTMNGAQGTGQIITQEMLEFALERNVPFRSQCHTDIDIEITEIDHESGVVGNVPTKAGLFIHGTCDPLTSSGGKSKIRPSKLHGIVETRTKPAMLTTRDGINPMLKGVGKFGKEVPLIDSRLIDTCASDVANNFNINVARLDISKYKRVLSFVEAIIGVEGDEYQPGLNRGTSLGIPLAKKYNNPNGKRIAYGDSEWILDSPVAKEIEQMVIKLKQDCLMGIQRGVYWADTLKDERRPVDKVDEGKTRVFCGGPVHFTILFRQYFLGFAAWLMHNKNSNEISPGTNVYSHDWNEIVSKLASRGKTKKGINVVAGDFSNFDGSLSSQILWYILDLINDWYDDGEENRKIRHMLWMHIVHAVHVNGNVVYQATHSQPSGCPITAILNSIYNSIIIRITYLLCAQKHLDRTGENYMSMEKFNQTVACVSYGDDNLIAIAEHILDWFNQVEITDAFKVIGHEYTDEAKSGVIVPIRDISEVAFLKRKFKWDPIANRYIAPLDYNVITEICQWTKKGLSADEITLANIDVTMRELSLHDRDTFEEFRSKLQKACLRENIPYRFLTYNEYRGDVLELPFGAEIRNKGKEVMIFHDPSLADMELDMVLNTIAVGKCTTMRGLSRKLALFARHRHITKLKTNERELYTVVATTNKILESY